jgi:two-component system nitrate/nitrite response regulator NarL
VSETVTTVLLADGRPLYLDALDRALAPWPELRVVGKVADGHDALAAIVRLCPDVAVLDADLPRLDGQRVIRSLVRDGHATRALLLSDACAPDRAYDALAHGAAGCLTRLATADELCRAVATAGRGGTYLPLALQGPVAGEIRLRALANRPLLSPREREVLCLMAEGLTLPEIAGRLQIGVTTVKTHAASLYEKLGVTGRAAAVAAAIRRQLID